MRDRFENEQRRSEGHRWRWIVIGTLAGLGLAWMLLRERGQNAVDRLRTTPWPRTIEARLSGVSWAPLRITRGAVKPSAVTTNWNLLATAQEVLHDTAGRRDADAIHARGVAYVYIARLDAAIETLHQAVSPTNAASWNDLAVAYDTVAHDRPWQFPTALAAIDQSLRIDPRSAAARFNRALILEHLGDTKLACLAWNDYLGVEQNGEWSAEARQRLRSLEQQNRSADFAAVIRAAASALEDGDDSGIRQLVAATPMEARTWAEGPLLAQWAESLEQQDTVAAARQLSFVKRIGDLLCEIRGECLLADAVTAIESDDATRARTLAAAHRIYNSARMQYSQQKPGEAETGLLRSAELFASARSPMADVALYFAANTIFDQNRSAEARRILSAVLNRLNRDRYKALHAQLRWQLARCEVVHGFWTAALQEARESARLFSELGESRNEAFVRALAADVYDYSGDHSRAWRHRVAALRELSRAGAAVRVRDVLANAVRALARSGESAAALSVADLVIEHLRDTSDAGLLADAFIQRARVAASSNDDARARDAVRDARAAIGKIGDRALRTRSDADLSVAEAIVLRKSHHGDAVSMLSRAIAFYSAGGYDAWLIDAYLQRARAYASLDDRGRAAADLKTAIDELERQRATITDDRTRSFFFDREPALFEEAIELLLTESNLDSAFAVAERGRARTLREQLGLDRVFAPVSMSSIQSALPDEAVLIELAFVQTGVALFVITPHGIDVSVMATDKERLRRLIREHSAAIERDSADDIRRTGMALYELLLKPVRSRIAGTRDLILVCDRELESIAWPALVDPSSGRYVAEDFSMSIAPSAAFFAAFETRSLNGLAVFVGNPEVAGRERLQYAEEEAMALAQSYASATLLVRRNATQNAVANAARESALLHIASHAQQLDEGQPVILLAGDDRFFDATEIANLKLRRTALVVLAACSTARGRTSHVEGIPSLGRAFLAAGAPAVVATLWDIDDQEAAWFFGRFHEQLRLGESPARACQRAQIDAIRSANPNRRQPRTWASVAVLGQGISPRKGASS